MIQIGFSKGATYKHVFRGTPYWKFFGKAWWITNKYGQLIYTKVAILELGNCWNLFYR